MEIYESKSRGSVNVYPLSASFRHTRHTLSCLYVRSYFVLSEQPQRGESELEAGGSKPPARSKKRGDMTRIRMAQLLAAVS